MAWLDVCRINFMTSVKKFTFQDNMTLAATLKKLSEESGVPVKTLKNWYYEEMKKYNTENGTNEEHTENIEENEQTNTKRRSCRACGKDVDEYFSHGNTGNPYGPKSKFYKTCTGCALKMKRTKSINEDGMECVCPHCGGGFKQSWSTVKARLVKYEKNLLNGEV